MGNSSVLYQSLLLLLDQGQWRDFRHLKTGVDMVVGLLLSASTNLTKWTPFAQGRALIAQSIQRRFIRWLNNHHIDVHQLYAPLIREALSQWGDNTLYLAFDTSLLWDRYCIIRICVVYRGRAVPIAWEVIEHGSASVAYRVYRRVLHRVPPLLPCPVGKVVLLADRGFADLALMRLCRRLKWRFHIRIKGNFQVYRHRHGFCSVDKLAPRQPGTARFYHYVALTNERFGPLHLALGNHTESDELWLIASDELTGLQTFQEYGLRFDIEENFLDDKSNGFQLESSGIRCAKALTRLCFGIAVATLYLTSQGTTVVAQGDRRRVDPHWFRGHSYLRIGWDWLRHALSRGWELVVSFRLEGGPDPDPVKASRAQYERNQTRFEGFNCKTLIYQE